MQRVVGGLLPMPSALARLAARRWAEPAGVAVVVARVLAGSVAEAYPVHHYGGLHLRPHPWPVAFALLALPAVLLLWRRSHPVAVYVAAVAAVIGWAASGQVYGAALVTVLVAYYSLAVARSGWMAVVVLGALGSASIWVAGGLGSSWGWLGGPQLDMWAEMVALLGRSSRRASIGSSASDSIGSSSSGPDKKRSASKSLRSA